MHVMRNTESILFSINMLVEAVLVFSALERYFSDFSRSTYKLQWFKLEIVKLI